MRRLRRCGPSSATFPGNCRATSESSLSGVKDAPFPRASICRWPAAKAILRLADLARVVAGGVRRTDCRLPVGVHLVAPTRPWSPSPPSRATRSGPDSSSPSNCDMRVLADDARFSMAEVTLGLVPDLGWHQAADRARRAVPGAGDLRDRPADPGATRPTGSAWPPPSCPATELPRAVADLAAAVLAADRARSPRSRRCSPARPTARTPSRTGPSGRRRPAACASWPAPASKTDTE